MRNIGGRGGRGAGRNKGKSDEGGIKDEERERDRSEWRRGEA